MKTHSTVPSTYITSLHYFFARYSLTEAGTNMDREYPYKQPMVIIVVFTLSCFRTNHIPNGAPQAKPNIREAAVTIDWKSYTL